MKSIFDIIENKNVKLLLIISCFLPLIIPFGYVFYNTIIDNRTGKQIFLDMRKEDKGIGIVMNHNILTLKIKDSIFKLIGHGKINFLLEILYQKKRVN